MPQSFTATPNPVKPGEEVTICVSPPPPSGVYNYIDVTFELDDNSETGMGLRLSNGSPCVTIMTPDNFITGWVTDVGNPPLIQQLVISRTV